ncbi:MAG TPA: alpha/beta hydrolase [Burkholderiaceae bacterium]|nr:alpha/beta hydrolase [Burkholderiaceae bacterium]
MQDRLISLVQALEDCRGFLASCATAPRVFPRTPLGEQPFAALERSLAALSEALALPPFARCARRPADVNSLDLALSRYLAIGADLAWPDPAQVPALVAQWRRSAPRPAVRTVAASSGGQLRVETWAAPALPRQAPVVLLLPICGLPLVALRPLMRELAQDHTVLGWESSLLAGMDPLPAAVGDPVTMMARDVADVVSACQLGQVHLVAICAATAPGLAAAHMLGPQVQSLSICHAAVRVGEQALATPFEQDYNAMLRAVCDSEEQARAVHGTLLEPGFAMSVPAALAPFILDPYTNLSRLRRHARVHGAATAYDARAIAGQIDCATLMLATRNDRMVHPEQSRRLAALMPNASLHAFDDGEHLDVLLAGNAFLPRIASFIAQHTPLLTEG